MGNAWTIAGIVVAYLIGRTAGEAGLMAELKKAPPPPTEEIEVSDAELAQVIDLVPGPDGKYMAQGGDK